MDFNLPALAEVDTLKPSEEGVAFPILSLVTGNPLSDNGVPVTITLMGVDSQRYKDLERARDDKRVKAKAEGKTFDEVQGLMDILVGCTKGWTGVNDSAGKPIAFSREVIAELYAKFPTIRDQMLIRLTERKNFTQASASA